MIYIKSKTTNQKVINTHTTNSYLNQIQTYIQLSNLCQLSKCLDAYLSKSAFKYFNNKRANSLIQEEQKEKLHFQNVQRNVYISIHTKERQ